MSERSNLWLKWCVSLTLLARGWLTWRGDSQIRGLVWNEDFWSGHIGMSWSDFAKQSDPWISNGLTVLGIGLMLLAIAPWLRGKLAAGMLWAAFAVLLLDGFAQWFASDYDLGMGIEHSLQIGTPLILLFAGARRWDVVVRVLIALTFVGHGLYAFGLHPVPLIYQTMTMTLLGVGQETGLLVLKVMGVLDFLAAIALFVRPLRLVALGYMVLWGGATALARLVAHVGLERPSYGLDPWIAEMLVRSSHWMIPLVLLLMSRRATPKDL